MTLFFYKETGRTITSDEMKDRFGTEEALPQLGICELVYQPDFKPFAFNPLCNNKYLPVEGDIQEQVQLMLAKGLPESEVIELIVTPLAVVYDLVTSYINGDVVTYDNAYWVRKDGSWLRISDEISDPDCETTSEPTTAY